MVILLTYLNISLLISIRQPMERQKQNIQKVNNSHVLLNHHNLQYSPYPGVPSERKVAEVHHGPVTGNTWTLSRLHYEAVSGLIPPTCLPFTL